MPPAQPATRADTLPLPTRRMLSTDQAAEYCGLSRNTFVERCPVKPVRISPGRVTYDRVALDQWLDSLSALPGTTGKWTL